MDPFFWSVTKCGSAGITPNYIETVLFVISSLKLSTREHGAEYISTVPIAFFNLLHGLT